MYHGIMGTRIIENEDERKLSVILTPFIPCSAKLPIISLFSSCFFEKNSGLISASLYFLAVIIIIFSAWIMKKLIFKNTTSTYISELPEYKIPDIKYIFNDVKDKILAFIKRAGTIILTASIIIWFLLSFSLKLEYGVDIENSILAWIGKKIAWIFYPMLGTCNWGVAVSTIQGLVAKEQVISSMSIIAGFADEGQIFEKSGIFGFFTASSAYAFMVFNLFSAPCFGAIGAMKRELSSNKNMFKAILYQTGIAWILATIIFNIGNFLNLLAKKWRYIMNFADIVTIIFLVLILGKIIYITFKEKTEDKCKRCPYNKNCDKFK